MYESLPCFSKQCRVLRHTASTCNKGTGHKRKKRYHKAPVRSGCSSPSAKTVAVEKQQPYSEGLHGEPSIDLMFAKVTTTVEKRLVSPGHKRTKLAEVGHSGAKHFASLNVVHVSDDRNVIADVKPPKRQYLTHSRVVVTTRFGQQGRHDGVTKNSVVADPRHQSPLMILLPHLLSDFLPFFHYICGSFFRELVPSVILLCIL